jgi:Ni,Fe-hydrogenase I cytochrome b subunit
MWLIRSGSHGSTDGNSAMTTFDYPAWLRVDHWLNVLFVTLIIRSGIEILAVRPHRIM